jgi:hypothetical protein
MMISKLVKNHSGPTTKKDLNLLAREYRKLVYIKKRIIFLKKLKQKSS